jgi:hypothetical protein
VKYIRTADADRIGDKLKAALGALEKELHRAIDERITPGMTASEARAVAEAEVGRMLRSVDQVEAAIHAELDDATVEIDDDDGEAR